MKKSDLIFGALLVPLDYILIVAAGLAAYAVRFSQFYIEHIREATVTIVFPDYVRLVLGLGLVWLIVFAIAGLYNLKGSRSAFAEVGKVVLACSTGILVVVVIIFLNRELFASRFIVLAGWVFAVILVSLGRVVARQIQRSLFKRGKGLHNLVVVGSNISADRLVGNFQDNPRLGYRVLEQLSDFGPDKARLLAEQLETQAIDEIILAEAELPYQERARLINFINDHNLDFRYAANFVGLARTNVGVEVVADVPVVEVKKTSLEGWGRIIKRLFDLWGALLGLLILLIPFIAIALVVKIDSRGPVFYRSHRIGGRGRHFHLLKFRSMKAGAHELKRSELKAQNERAEGPLFKMSNDPRVTRVGKILRRWSIDELPQLWNVLTGDISLVGPRPHEPEEVAQYERHHKRLLDIKPGITGLAQVSGRSDLSFEDEVRLDTYYIQNWTPWLDLKILLQTPKAVLGRRQAE